MRDTKSAKLEPSVGSWLGQCLMDSDPETARLARWNRRRSMALSSLIQTALLTAAIVVPLFASQSIPGFRNEPRLPSPRGIPIVDARPPGTQPTQSSGPRRPSLSEILQPRIIPSTIPPPDRTRGDDAPFDAAPSGAPGCPGCSLDGVHSLDPRIFDSMSRTAPAPKVPAPDSRPRFVRVSQPVQEAKLIHRVTPTYPPLARQIRKEGRVELHAIIATDGTMRELEVISGDPLFIQSALDAVRQWRYQPTLLGNEPIEVQTRITVIFVLSR